MALGERRRRERAISDRGRTGGGTQSAHVETPLHIDTVPIPMLILDARGRVVDANTHASLLLGRGASQLRAMTAFELLGRDVLWVTNAAVSASAVSTIDLPTGQAVKVIVSVGSFGGSADAPHTVVVLTPIPAGDPEREHSAPQVRNFNDAAEMVAKLHGDTLCVAIGVLGLLSVNDSFSRSAGDTALATIENRIHSLSPSGAVVVRTGGDRFVVVAARPDDPTAAITALTAAIRAPISTALGDVAVGCAVGVTVGPSRPARVLLDRADRNLDVALAKGAGSIEWRDVPRPAATQPLGRLSVPLLEMLARDGMSAEFQAVVDLSTGRIVEYEAFPRWDEHSTGHHSAAQVIRVASDIGAIDDLGVGVLRRSLELCARLKANGHERVRVSVNVSTSELALQSFASRTLSMLAGAGVPGSMLQIELTARDSTIDAEHLRPNVLLLRGAGVRFALGVGHNAANLFAVRDLGIDSIKLNAALTTDVADEMRSTTLLAALLDFARRIGADAVMKGVETVEQHNVLRRGGCAYGQGNLYQRPQTESEVIDAGHPHVQLPVDEAEQPIRPESRLRACPPVLRVSPTIARVAVMLHDQARRDLVGRGAE
jgi:EAL domain-containing protein (putative c-di-GMP-specific phosphodiesterase class I)/GGDEF domain-containing protein